MLHNNPRVVYGFYFLILLVSTLFLLHKRAHATTPPTQIQANLKEYYESGKYFEEVETRANEVKDYLSRQSPLFRHKPLAIVFDIDETALSNYQSLKRLSFSQNKEAITASFMLAKGEPIPSILALYQYAVQQKIAVFFISERPDTPEIKKATTENLVSAGFTKWQELIMKPLQDESNIETFKINARKKIVLQGFDIVANIGDQDADINGGFAEVKSKLPNPFYGAA